jgi:mono/diheme cytochrome c family protein
MTFSPFLTVFLGLCVTGMMMLTGCSVPEASTEKAVKVAAEPIINPLKSGEDFAFPSAPPKLSRGKAVYQTHCASCHTTGYWQQAKVRDTVITFTTPIDGYLMLTQGKAPKEQFPSQERRQLLPASHPAFRNSLSRDDRWAALMYVRYLAGGSDIQYTSKDGKPLDVASIYGGNCAVCHGKRGYADGPLHSGHASSHELQGAKTFTGLFQPPPANFHDYARMYNRTDAQMYRYIVQGLYPSGMPPWLGRVDKDYNFVWDDKLIWMVVRHERTFAYDNDLEGTPPAGPIPSYQVEASYEPLGRNFEQVHQLTPLSGHSSGKEAAK